MDISKPDVVWADLGDWITVDNLPDSVGGASIQELRARMEEVFGWTRNAEILMRIPHALLAGETPWDVLYYTPDGPRRIKNVLDLVEQGRLRELAKYRNAAAIRRRAV